MKYRLISLTIIAATLMAFFYTALAEYTYYGTMMVDNCEEWVSLRDGPGTGCGRLAKVPLYAIVTDAEWNSLCDDFIYCNYDGQYGYILSQYLVPWTDPEPGDEVLFESDLGFSFRYDSVLMCVDENMSEDGQSLLLYAADSDLPIYMEIMTSESVGVLPWKFLELNAPAGTQYIEDATENGAAMHWFQKPSDYNADIIETYYAVDGTSDFVVAVATCPFDELAAWGEVFIGIMRSISFETSTPVRVDWAEVTSSVLVVDQDGEYVTLMADAPVTHVELLALELVDFDEDGNVAYDATVLYEQDAITPDEPLVVKLAFPGDTPNYGIRLIDAEGESRRFAIQISGRDGSLSLTEY